MSSIIRTKEVSANSRPQIQWKLRKYWNQEQGGHRTISVSHPFSSPYISFIPSVSACSALATAGHRAGGSCPHLHLRTKDSGPPHPSHLQSWAGLHLIRWPLGPFPSGEGDSQRFLSSHYPWACYTLSQASPVCASKSCPCLRITWKHFQNICFGLPREMPIQQIGEGHRNLYIVKVSLMIANIQLQNHLSTVVPWVCHTILNS